jgi:aryl-alcohol dehydrogenase-like predicted oxidoreductase
MQMRAFGNTTLHTSTFGLGCARLGGVFQGDALGFIRVVAIARDAGINFFDTADMYSQGESESILGRALGAERSQVVIATKVGYSLTGQRKLAARLKPFLRPIVRALKVRRDQLPAAARGTMSQDFSSAYLVRALEASLRRLRTDYVDILQLHSPPLEVVERGEWQSTLEDLKRAGKIRYYGIACDSLESGLAALRYPGVSSLQFTFSVLEQGAQKELLPSAQARGVGSIARECLGNGLLAKPASEIQLASYCSSPEEEQRRITQLQDLRQRAEAKGISLARLALEYVRDTEGLSVALVGARTPQQLRRLLDELSA